MAFLLTLGINAAELGPVLEHLMKQGVRLLDVSLAEKPAAKQLTGKRPFGATTKALHAVITKGVEVSQTFQPKAFLGMVKMPKGSFYSSLGILTKKGIIEKVSPGLYRRVK